MLDILDSRTSATEAVQQIYDCMLGTGDEGAAIDAIRLALGAEQATLTDAAQADRDAAPCPRRLTLREPGDRSQRRIALSLTRAEWADAFTSDDIVIADDLMRHLCRARALSTRLSVSEVERQVSSDLFDRLAIGAIFLASDGRVIGSIGHAQRLLDRRNGLRLRGENVAAVSGTCDRKLQAAIKSVLQSQTPGETEVVTVSRAGEGRDLGLAIRAVDTATSPEGAACVILVRDTEWAGGNTPERSFLRRLFDLTQAEAEVACTLTAGLSLDEAAAALSISRNTARAHLRAIFSKSGVGRQSELMRLVMTSAAMIGGPAIAA